MEKSKSNTEKINGSSAPSASKNTTSLGLSTPNYPEKGEGGAVKIISAEDLRKEKDLEFQATLKKLREIIET